MSFDTISTSVMNSQFSNSTSGGAGGAFRMNVLAGASSVVNPITFSNTMFTTSTSSSDGGCLSLNVLAPNVMFSLSGTSTQSVIFDRCVSTSGNGGGIYLGTGSGTAAITPITLEYIAFTSCHAMKNGGAVSTSASGASPTSALSVTSVTASGCHSSRGGSFDFEYTLAVDGAVTFSYVDVTNSQATGGSGGALNLLYHTSLVNSGITFETCQFDGCSSTGNGGSVNIFSPLFDMIPSTTVHDCTFGNSISSGGAGGALSLNVTSVTSFMYPIVFSGSDFSNTMSSLDGGAVFISIPIASASLNIFGNSTFTSTFSNCASTL